MLQLYILSYRSQLALSTNSWFEKWNDSIAKVFDCVCSLDVRQQFVPAYDSNKQCVSRLIHQRKKRILEMHMKYTVYGVNKFILGWRLVVTLRIRLKATHEMHFFGVCVPVRIRTESIGLSGSFWSAVLYSLVSIVGAADLLMKTALPEQNVVKMLH